MAWTSEIKHCRSAKCRARIIWLPSAKSGKPMPFDAEPISDQDALAEPRGVYFRGEDGCAVAWTPTLSDSGPLYRSHWGTCADQASFRRKS